MLTLAIIKPDAIASGKTGAILAHLQQAGFVPRAARLVAVCDVYEPFLLQQGFIQRTPKGRMATRRAYEKLGRDIPQTVQAQLFS